MKTKLRDINLDAAEQALFLRAAEHVIAETYDVKFPPYLALQYIPIRGDGGPSARTITYRQYDVRGMAKIVSSYAKDFPRVDIAGKEFHQTVHSIGDSYGYNVQEIREFQAEGISIDSMRARAAREAIVQKMNKIGWLGDDAAGLRGILTHPNITKAAAGTGSWTTSTNRDLVLKDVSDAIEGPNLISNGVEIVDTCLLSKAKYSFLATTPYSTTIPTSLLKILHEQHPGVFFAPVPECLMSFNPRTGAIASTHVILTYRRDPSRLWFAIPMDFEQFAPQAQGMEWVVYCHARVAGIITPYPLSARITDGI